MDITNTIVMYSTFKGANGKCDIAGIGHNCVSKQHIKTWLENQNRINPSAIGVEDLGKSSTEYYGSREYCEENNLEHFILDRRYHSKDGWMDERILDYSEEVIKQNESDLELVDDWYQLIENMEKSKIEDVEKSEMTSLRDDCMAIEIMEKMKQGYKNIVVFVGAQHSRPSAIAGSLTDLEDKYGF